VRLLKRLYLPARFPMHALQMTGLYMGQLAPSSFITNTAYFQAADELRRIQWAAYRTKSLSLEHDAELVSSAQTRLLWGEDPAWQPLREAVEKMLIAYDWGEAFAALNLTVKPVFDAVFNVQLAEQARAHEDDLLALTLDDLELDSERSRDWTSSAGPIRHGAATRQYRVAQAMGEALEAAGLSGSERVGRAVRTSTSSAASPGCCGKSAGRAPRLLDSVRPQCG
jgi:toluene monooxygenase system protein E